MPVKYRGKPLAVRFPLSSTALGRLLDGLPADEVFETRDVMTRFRVSLPWLDKLAPTMHANWQMANGHKRYWGSRKAIAEMRRDMKRPL